MNRNRRRNVSQPHGVGRQVPGCLSRMVNLFDFGTVGKKLLTDKPYFDHESIKRKQIEDKVDARNGTPMKMLLAEEMSKEMEFNLCSSNLVAKLMGLDSFPDAVVRTSKPGELSRKKMDVVRDKFLEAKRLVTDDKLRNSKEFQEAMEVLSSNKELFLEFLQESNNFFSHHLQSFQCTGPPTPEKSKRVTILKPSKKLGSEAAAIESPRDGTRSEKGLHMFKWPGEEEYPRKQSTRIVVLKPNGHVGLPADDFEEMDIKDVARRVKLKEETLHPSVFSNGYIGDDSYYADSEIISPVCRHSWDYVNKYDSPFSSPESSSVCREAKKRLSERWALMAASNENLEEDKVVNISLGDMLSLSDSKTEDEEANDGNEEQDRGASASCLAASFSREEGNLKPFNSLMRSKSLPESSTSLGKSKSMKWSLNFLFSRNKKASKERSYEESHPESLDSRCNNECDASMSARSMVSREAGLSVARSITFGNSSEWRDEPSPSSVLETCFDEDDGIFFNSSVLNEPEMMMSNLLGKSPSIGRNVSFDDSTVARCYSSKRSTRDEEEDFRLLINTLLSAAYLDEDEESWSILDNLLSKWHSLESPLDPSLRDSYANSTEQQRLGSNLKKLVFDLVNTLLMELTPSYPGPKILSGKTLGVYVINRMHECLKGNGRVEDRWWDEDGDLSSLAVNKVVRMEVAEIGSPESLRLEMHSMGEELELKLLEELVEEAFMDLSEQPKLFIPSIG